MKKKLISLILISLLLSGCGQKSTVEDAPELLEPVGVNMDTATVRYGNFVNLEYYTGSLVPACSEVYFSVDGQIDTVYAYQGKWVEKGEQLIGLDLDDINEEIEDITKKLDNIEQEGSFSDRLADNDIQMLQVEHQQAVNAAGYWSDQATLLRLQIEQATLQKNQSIEARNAEISALTAKLDELNQKITEQVITAPHAGHIYFADTVKAGSYVRAGKTVCYVTDPSKLTFVTTSFLSDSELERNPNYCMINGQKFDLTIQPLIPADYTAAIAAGKDLGRSFTINASEEELASLSPGMFGVLIIETKTAENVITVPENAVKHDSAGFYVYVMNGSSRERRDIEVGYSNDVERVVLSGLSEGEVIYVQD